MTSIHSKLLRWGLSFLDIKTFYDDPEKVPAKLAKLRKKGPSLPGKRFRKKYNVTHVEGYAYRVFKAGPSPARQDTGKCVIYFHGGGYVLDIDPAHWNFIGRLIDSTGYTVIVPIYLLAPETTCAALIPQMTSFFEGMAKMYGAENITLMGDSAGGGLSLAVAQAARGKDLPMPEKMVLLSPWLDVVSDHPLQFELQAKDPIISISALKGFGGMYAGDLPLNDPRVSPLFGDQSGLPPVQLFIGTDDPLLPDATRFRDTMDGLETSIRYHEYENMFHVWMLLPIPEGKQAMREIAEFLR